MSPKLPNYAPKCEYCNGTLVPIGSSRANGKNHADWANRRLHKKCWKEVQESERSERSEKANNWFNSLNEYLIKD